MKWLRLLVSKKERRLEDPLFRDKLDVLLEIRKAHAEWVVAHTKFDWVVEKDQIDCAIYALEAAQKRYEMLLRQAKLFGWDDGLTVASQAHGIHVNANITADKNKKRASSF